MNHYEEAKRYLIDYYQKSPELQLDTLLTGATEHQILEFEHKLGVTVSQDYRKFLQQFGALWFETLIISGIVSSNPNSREDHANSLWLTISEREKSHLPNHYVILSDSGMGEWYVLDTTTDRVELIDDVNFEIVPEEPEESYLNFSEFFYKKVIAEGELG